MKRVRSLHKDDAIETVSDEAVANLAQLPAVAPHIWHSQDRIPFH